MRRILVAGAGGGIGLALVDALAARADVEQVYALHRHPVSSTSDRVTWLCAEFDQEGALQAIVQRIRQEGGLDTLLVATGLLHGVGLAPEKSLNDLEISHLLELYRVNAVIPLMLLEGLPGAVSAHGKSHCLHAVRPGRQHRGQPSGRLVRLSHGQGRAEYGGEDRSY